MSENHGLTPQDIVRAWKDEEFRASLTEAQGMELPDTPSDIAELSDEELELIAGGMDWCICTKGCTLTGSRRCDAAVAPSDPISPG